MAKLGRPKKSETPQYAESGLHLRTERRLNSKRYDFEKYGHLEGNHDEPNDYRID